MAFHPQWIKEQFNEERHITIYGTHRLVMEGVERIIFCDPEKMILKGNLTLTVTGENLCLSELGNGNLAILGKIFAVSFAETA